MPPLRSALDVTAIIAAATVGVACGRLGFDAREGLTSDSGVDAVGLDAAEMERIFEGEDDIVDDSAVSSSPTSNCGNCARINSGPGEAGLLRIEVSALPADSTVVSAVLEVWLRTTFTPGGKTDAFVVTEAWAEGDGDDEPGVPNWTERLPGEAWSSEGVGPESRAPDPFATFVPLSLEVPIQIEIPPDIVESWNATPSENFGIVFKGRDYPGPGGDHPHFFSTEAEEAATRGPRLIVTYADPT